MKHSSQIMYYIHQTKRHCVVQSIAALWTRDDWKTDYIADHYLFACYTGTPGRSKVLRIPNEWRNVLFTVSFFGPILDTRKMKDQIEETNTWHTGWEEAPADGVLMHASHMMLSLSLTHMHAHHSPTRNTQATISVTW